MALEFVGTVQFRSSVSLGVGPPGESEILALNPERETRILRTTGWPHLQAGSLNLTVSPDVVFDLLKLRPDLIEDGSTIHYPQKFAHIPKIRVAYHYYMAAVDVGGVTEPALVRCAKNPVPGRVELFAAVSLKEKFRLGVGDSVNVAVHAA